MLFLKSTKNAGQMKSQRKLDIQNSLHEQIPDSMLMYNSLPAERLPPKRNKLIQKIIEMMRVKEFIEVLKSRLVPRVIPNIRQFEQEKYQQDQLQSTGIDNSNWAITCLLLATLLFNFLQLFFLTFSIVFDEFYKTTFQVGISCFFVFVQLGLILLNCVTFRQVEGVIVSEPRIILVCYLKSSFSLDFCLFIMQLLSFIKMEFCIGVYLLRIIGIRQTVRLFERSFIDTEMKENIWRICFLFFFNLFISNIMSLIMSCMPLLDSHITWKTKFKIDGQVWWIQYIWTFYWSITTMMTVGYGDIVPSNYKQALIITFIQLVGGIMYVYNINAIGNIFSTMNEQQKNLNRKLRVMRKLFNREHPKISKKLQNELINNVRNQQRQFKQLQIKQEQQIIQNLQRKNKQNLRVSLCQNVVRDINFFRQFSKEVKYQLAQTFKRVVFLNREYFTQKKCINQHIYLLQRGTVSTVFEIEGKTSKQVIIHQRTSKLGTLMVYGLKSFLLNRSQNFSTKSEDVCEVLQIRVAKLLQILTKNKIDREKLCFEKDFALFNKFTYVENCELCRIKHYEFCPRYHYTPIKSIVVLKSNKLINSSNPHFLRRLRNKRTLFKLSPIEPAMDQFNNDFNHEVIFDCPSENMDEQDMKKLMETRNNLAPMERKVDKDFQKLFEWNHYYQKYNLERQIVDINKRSSANMQVIKLVKKRKGVLSAFKRSY